MSTETSCHFGHLLQVSKKISLTSDFIQFFSWFYTCIYSPGVDPLGMKYDVNRNILSLRSFVASLKKSLWSLILYIFFMILYMYIAPGQGQTIPRGQNFYVNRNVLSLHLFVASLKKSLKCDIIHFFFTIYTAPGQWQTAPREQNFDVNGKALSLYPFVASFKEISLKWFIHFFHDLIHVYSPGAGGMQPPGDKVLMSKETSYHFGHVLLVSNRRRH